MIKKISKKKYDTLRFITCGSVDDGKSTLLGRLLYDNKSIYEDQLSQVKKDTKSFHNKENIDFSLLLDGLLAEREQKITIDVSYRYFHIIYNKLLHLCIHRTYSYDLMNEIYK